MNACRRIDLLNSHKCLITHFLIPAATDRSTCTVPGVCDCLPGYSGHLCQNDDDVCGHVSPCVNGAACENAGPNDYTCTCQSGYTGVNCAEEVDACVVDSPCLNGALCSVSIVYA